MNRSDQVTVIAEIGTSHGGNLSKAYRMIDAAKEAGADCVKFQWVYAAEILHPDTGFVQLPGGPVRLYDRFKELEVPPSFYKKLCDYTHKQGLLFACSPFGIKSLVQLWKIKPDAIKIASPELNHFPMLKKLLELERKSRCAVPVILSSGVSTMADIKKTIDFLSPLRTLKPNPESSLPNLSLLHCITSYPAPETEYNLAVLKTFAETLDIIPGVSDHSLSPIIVPGISVAAGGLLIEKHITLSKETDGLDDPVALTPSEFAEMTAFVRSISNAEPDMRIQMLQDEFGEELIEEVLGTGIKDLAPAEESNYGRTNRSIHYMKSFKKGHKLSAKDVAVLRTEKVLTPGISPEYLEKVIGARLKQDVSSGSGLLLEHLE